MPPTPGLFFSTFEPSGDLLCAQLISRIRQLRPDLPIYGYGGEHMEKAGAEIIEHTTHLASMFLDTLKQVFEHKRRLERFTTWLADHPLVGFVPTDSPAGNWSICKVIRKHQPNARIVHVVAPQFWAWGPWRIKKMRKLSDHVLCLLPFEPKWFSDRGFTGEFVGHPMLDPNRIAPNLDHDDLDTAHPRLALLPGSRRGELTRNWPVMLNVLGRLREKHPGLVATVTLINDNAAQIVREIANKHYDTTELPTHIKIALDRTEAVLDWCDVALLASGTVALQGMVRDRPMVAMYRMGIVTVLIAGIVKCTKRFTLPNIVADYAGLGQIIPEIIPNIIRTSPIIAAVDHLLSKPDATAKQREGLAKVINEFKNTSFSEIAPHRLLAAIEGQAT